jgi:hypothetical protein
MKMKTIMSMFTVLVLVLVFQGSSHAQMVPIDYTGAYIQQSAANPSLGVQYFQSPSDVSSLFPIALNNGSIYATYLQFYAGSGQPLPQDFSLYVPAGLDPYNFPTGEVSVSILSNAVNNTPNDLLEGGVWGQYSNVYNQTQNSTIPIDIGGATSYDFQPGYYWLEVAGGSNGGDEGGGIAEIIDVTSGVATAPVPEPPTIWLFLAAAIGFVMLRRNNVLGCLV